MGLVPCSRFGGYAPDPRTAHRTAIGVLVPRIYQRAGQFAGVFPQPLEYAQPGPTYGIDIEIQFGRNEGSLFTADGESSSVS